LIGYLSNNYHSNKPPSSKAKQCLKGEFITEYGSKLTFIDCDDKDWSTGEVLVELASDADYLLEGKDNNTIYRYGFGWHHLPVNYDVADDIQLSNGNDWFAKCFSRYTGDYLILNPYLPSGDELIFKRVIKPSENGT